MIMLDGGRFVRRAVWIEGDCLTLFRDDRGMWYYSAHYNARWRPSIEDMLADDWETC